jgi:hypothetical protein
MVMTVGAAIPNAFVIPTAHQRRTGLRPISLRRGRGTAAPSAMGVSQGFPASGVAEKLTASPVTGSRACPVISPASLMSLAKTRRPA